MARGSRLLLALLGVLLPGGFLRAAPSDPSEPIRLHVLDLSRRAERRDIYYRRALDYLQRFHREDLAQAIRLLGQVTKIDNDFAPAYGALAEVRAWRFLWGWDPAPAGLQQALDQGMQAVRLDPEASESHLGLGLAYLAADRFTPALKELDRAVSLNPDSFRAHLYRGMLLRGLKRVREAGADATRALDLGPDSPMAYSLLGDYYQERHEFPAARQAYLAAAELDQNLLWPRLGVAATYQKELNFAAAEKTYAVTEVAFPEDPLRCRIMAASLLVATQDYESALKIYEGISEEKELSPPLVRRLLQAGRAYSLEKIGKWEQAEYYWNQIVREFPSDFDGAVRDREVVSQAYEALVRYHDDKGEAKRSDSLLNQACGRPGMSFSLYASLAERQRKAGHLGRAVGTLRLGLRGAPEDLDMINAIQAVLPILRSVGAGKASSAARAEASSLVEELALRLEEAEPPSYVPYLNLARAASLVQQPWRALDHLRRAVDKGFRDLRHAAEDPDLKSLSRDPAFRELIGAP